MKLHILYIGGRFDLVDLIGRDSSTNKLLQNIIT